MIKWIIAALLLASFVASILYVHFRGRERYGFFRQLSDGNNFLAPVNAIMYLFSRLPEQPFHDEAAFPELAVIRENWQMIRDEGLALEDHIRASDKRDDAGFNSFFRRGWKRFYLKWYSDNHPSAEQLCPATTKLLAGIPSVKAAMFAQLPAGSKLMRHRDPYAGSIRYHLGLRTPNNDNCYINVDGQIHSWRDGQAVLFDETYIHYAHNNTERDRLILFCDIERPLKTRPARAFNRWFSRTVMAAAASPNTDQDSTGLVNRLFGRIYALRERGKALKEFNKPLYLIVKWVLLALPLALFLLFVWWL